MTEQIKRQRIYEGSNGVIDKLTIDFNPGLPPNLQKLLTSSQITVAGNKLAVVVVTSGCAGIAGSFGVRQSTEDSGTPNFPFAPAVSIPLVASGAAEGGVAVPMNFVLSHVVLDASGVTWPTEGRMMITIVTKF